MQVSAGQNLWNLNEISGGIMGNQDPLSSYDFEIPSWYRMACGLIDSSPCGSSIKDLQWAPCWGDHYLPILWDVLQGHDLGEFFRGKLGWMDPEWMIYGWCMDAWMISGWGLNFFDRKISSCGTFRTFRGWIVLFWVLKILEMVFSLLSLLFVCLVAILTHFQ